MAQPHSSSHESRYTSPKSGRQSDPEDQLLDALKTLESVASPTAYWYADERSGFFDRLVEWQERKKAAVRSEIAASESAASQPAYTADSGIQRKMAVTMAAVVTVCAILGVVVGLRFHGGESSRVAAAQTFNPPVHDPASSFAEPTIGIMSPARTGSGEVPTVSITEAAPHAATASGFPLGAAFQDNPGTKSDGSDAAQGPATSDQSGAGLPPSAELDSVNIYTPPVESPSRVEEPPSPRIEITPEPPPAPQPRARVRRQTAQRDRASDELSEEESRRVDREAERAFREEYKKETSRKSRGSGKSDRSRTGRRIYDEWNPEPLNKLDRKHPDWGWE